VILAQLPEEPEPRREFPHEFPPFVSDHVEAAAPFGSVQRKGSEDDMSANRYAPSDQVHVRSTVSRFGEEVKDRSIVPHFEAAEPANLGSVGADPVEPPSSGP
jgi:hypothetical protein